MQINVMCVFRDFCSHAFGRSCQRQVLILSVNTCADNTIIIMRAGLCVLVVFAGLLSHQADQCHDCDAKEDFFIVQISVTTAHPKQSISTSVNRPARPGTKSWWNSSVQA